jgi:tetratricopeptide (TPR) repeat protein
MDKEFYEAFVAIGSYKYWKSNQTEFLNWLPFVDDEKELGIKYLQKAVEYSGYSSHLAINSLAWIYIEQKDFSSAIKLADSALKEHPNSRIYIWILARCYQEVDVSKSISLYQKVLESYPKDLKSNKINEVTLKHLIAQQLVKIKKKDEALNLCNEILSIKGYTNFEKDALNNRLERVQNLKKDITNK